MSAGRAALNLKSHTCSQRKFTFSFSSVKNNDNSYSCYQVFYWRSDSTHIQYNLMTYICMYVYTWDLISYSVKPYSVDNNPNLWMSNVRFPGVRFASAPTPCKELTGTWAPVFPPVHLACAILTCSFCEWGSQHQGLFMYHGSERWWEGIMVGILFW